MRSQSILNSVAIAMVTGAGIVVSFSAYSSYLGRDKHPLDADVEAVLAGTDKPLGKSQLPAPIATATPGDRKNVPQSSPAVPAVVVDMSAAPGTSPLSLATNDETELARRREIAIANNPKLAQLIQEVEAQYKRTDEAKTVAAAFLADPTAETAAALDRTIADLRKPEHLGFRGGVVPLRELYGRLTAPAEPGVGAWAILLHQLDQWQELSPQSSAPMIAKAGALIQYAWQARGSGTADKVTEEGGQKFNERIAEARGMLEKASELEGLDADFYRCRVTIEMASGGDPEVVSEAVKKGRELAPEYYDLYIAAANFLLPRWHGEPGDVEEFANKLYDDIGGDLGKLAFLHVAQFVHGKDRQTLPMGKYDRAKIRAAMDMVFTTPQAQDVILFCGECCWALQDPKLARRFYERTKNTLQKDLMIPALEGTRRLAMADADFDGGDHLVWLPHAPGLIDFSPDGKILAIATRALRRSPILAISTESKGIVGAFPPEEGAATWCRFVGAERNSLLYDSDDNKTCHFVLRNLRRPTETLIFDNVEATNLLSAMSDDGSRLVAIERLTGNGFVWDGKSGIKKRDFKVTPHPQALFFTPDHKFAILGFDSFLLHDPDSENVVDLFEKAPNRDWRISHAAGMQSPSKILIAGVTNSSRTERWQTLDFASGAMKDVLTTTSGILVSRLSPDGRFLAYLLGGIKTHLVVYDLQAGKLIQQRTLFLGGAVDLAIVPDGSMVAVADGFHLIRFYDIKPEENTGK